MSLIGTISTAASAFSGLFGGGNGSAINIARGFERKTGLSVPQEVAEQLKPRLNALAAARGAALPFPGKAVGVTPVATDLGPAAPGMGGTGGPLQTIQRGIGQVGGAITRTFGGGQIQRTVTGRVSKIILPSGQEFSRRRAASLIRRVGFEVATTALAISAVEAAEILLADSQAAARRRRRGITHAQIRNARSTICRVNKLAKDLGCKPTTTRRRVCR